MSTVHLTEAIAVNPELPDGFWSSTPLELRPEDHLDLLGKPFIQTVAGAHSPSETRFEVVCLEAGPEDRPVVWGIFPTLDEAMACAAAGMGPIHHHTH
jgi:hypothetical protein